MLAVRCRDDLAIFKTIDQGLAAVDIIMFQQKMSWQANSEERESKPAGYFHINDRQ